MSGIVSKRVDKEEFDRLVSKEYSMGGPGAIELGNYLKVENPTAFDPLENEEHDDLICDALERVGACNWEVSRPADFYTKLSVFIPKRQADQNDLFMAVVETSLLQGERTIFFIARVSRCMLLHMCLQDQDHGIMKAAAMRRVEGKCFPINTLGDLRAAVASCEGLPDEKMVVNQVVGSESGAWNMAMDFIPKIRNGTLTCFSMSHPNLKNLPMKDGDCNIEVWRGE